MESGRKRLLIIGCGDIARRALPGWCSLYDVSALVRRHDEALAARGVRVLPGDLDRPDSLASLACSADLVAHCAPPQDFGNQDLRTRSLVAALAAARTGGAMLPQRVVYISTSGVYGDCGGALIDEERPVNPQTDRARRRVDAESVLTHWCRENRIAVAILRVPGIYASDRLPTERLRRGTPVLAAADDVYTNHVHADDLAAMLTAALARGAGAYNACDDTDLKMGDYFDLVADRLGLPRPPRIGRVQANEHIPGNLLSFMGESRRLANRRMKDELGIRLLYPTVFEGVPRRVAVTG